MLPNINVDNIVEMALRNHLVKYKLEKLNCREIYKKNRKLFKEDLCALLRTYKTDIFMESDERLMHWDHFVEEYGDFVKFAEGESLFSACPGYPENLKQFSEKAKKIYSAWRYLRDQKLL
ncbi:hypothetical protein BNJ_00040 [Kaumoebavirus]|uniref:hypothetical protein n=1 Tax=Kaumoebavirus TaxID=1859492 RepID=UPI0009C27C10|nr:hypothetical protein BNJ_00040 [Kaumoebavirus]ARA71883.1 hypothetical protein BNJ_00040 [Kaumoebavirus]